MVFEGVCVCICMYMYVYVDACKYERERMRLLRHTIPNANVYIFPSIFIHFRRRHQYIDIGTHTAAHTHGLPNKKKNVKLKRRETRGRVTCTGKKCGNIKRIEAFFFLESKKSRKQPGFALMLRLLLLLPLLMMMMLMLISLWYRPKYSSKLCAIARTHTVCTVRVWPVCSFSRSSPHPAASPFSITFSTLCVLLYSMASPEMYVSVCVCVWVYAPPFHLYTIK